MDQGTHKPQGPAGPGARSSGRAGDLGAGPRFLASLDRTSESSSWNNWSTVYMCSINGPQSSWAEEEKWDGAVHTCVKAVCVYGVVAKALLWEWGSICLLGLRGTTSAVSQLWACYGRIFPGSWSPLESAAFHRSMAAPTFKLCLHLILVLDKETSDLISTVRAVTVPGARTCSYQAGSSSPWEQSSCELWMHRVCLRPSESGSAPSPGSHTHPSDSSWQHLLLTSSPSPLPSGYLEYKNHSK